MLAKVADRRSDRLRRGEGTGVEAAEPFGHQRVAVARRQPHAAGDRQPSLPCPAHTAHDLRPHGLRTIRPGPRGRDQSARIEPLARSHRLPPAVALCRRELGCLGAARGERRELALARRAFPPARLEMRADFGGAGRERLDHRARHAGDVERAVARILRGDGRVAERLDAGAQGRGEHRAHDVLAVVQRVGAQRPPLAVGRLRRVGDDAMDVELRLAVAVDVVEEGRGDKLARSLRLLVLPVPHPRLGEVALGPAKGRRRRLADRAYEACIAADKCKDRQRLRRRHRQVPPWAMLAALGIELAAVGQLAGKDLREPVGIDRAVEAELGRPCPAPCTRVMSLVGGVIVVAGIIARRVAGRADDADRDHRRCAATPGSALTVTVMALPPNSVRQVSVAMR